MEAVLHIEPIIRQTRAPLSVGHTDYIFYGEKPNEDGENVGTPVSSLKLGCPLESVDGGSTRSHVPLVKTIEYMPDFSRDKGHVYAETLHYFKDQQILIPFRSKIRTGLGQGTRFTHLPSLNLIRENITGLPFKVNDPRAEIVEDILLRDHVFDNRENNPLKEWINDELSIILSKKTTNQLSFDTSDITSMTNRYIHQIHHTPSEFSSRHLKEIMTIVSPESFTIPHRYLSDDSIKRYLADFKNNLIPHQFNFRSFGCIPIGKIDRIDYNPFEFQKICELIDRIPLTDFNVDIVVTQDCDIVFYHEHIALDRFENIEDSETGLYRAETILKEYFDGYMLNEMLHKFVLYHSEMTSEIEDLIDYNAVKIKIIKTLSDEAAILLYRANSSSDNPPLCGVYFDIALQSLAPMSIISEPIIN